METISRGSYSRLNVYETCPRRAMYAYVEKIPEPLRPTLPAGKEYPNDRGDRVHKEIEAFARAQRPSPPRETHKFEPEIIKLKDLVTRGQAKLEDPWYFTDSWTPTTYEHYTYQVRLDASIDLGHEPQEVAVVDYKTGKRFGNEVKHADQARLYGLASMIRFPEAVKVHTEIWYVDHDELTSIAYNSSLKFNLMAHYSRRFATMFEDRIFRPKPNAYSCSFCSYKTGHLGRTDLKGSGHCKLNP